jgi:copper chaperone CopZ
MFKSKKVLGIILACLMIAAVGGGTAYAATADEQPTAIQQTVIEELQNIAAGLSIDTTGMTTAEIKDAISETGYGNDSPEIVETTGVTEEQHIKGPLTEEEMPKELIHDDLVDNASRLGIDTTGMSDAQIIEALDAYKQNAIENGETHEVTRAELEEKAAAVGVDPTGLTDAQLMDRIKHM